MGWQNDKQLSTGVTAQHWAASAIHFDIKSNMIKFEYLGYLDEESKMENKDALILKTKMFTADFNASVPDLLSKLITFLEAETSNEPV